MAGVVGTMPTIAPLPRGHQAPHYKPLPRSVCDATDKLDCIPFASSIAARLAAQASCTQQARL